MSKFFLVTGVAGFIGFHTAMKLLSRRDSVIGVDCVSDYYDTDLKEKRLDILSQLARELNIEFIFYRENLINLISVRKIFSTHQFDRVIHLAAQAGVRHSLDNPQVYVENNILAFTNVLEACRYSHIPHLIYASTSSVYGANTKLPFSEHDSVNHPLSFYAATKKANELMAHTYSHLFGLPTTGLRFFTVYGPWGRPDMALFLFTKNIIEGNPIKVFNNGNHTRDFTYVDDIIEGVVRISDQIAPSNLEWNSFSPDPGTSNAPYRIFNIGNSHPVKLIEYIEAIEEAVGKTAIKEMLPIQAGDLTDTYAEVSDLVKEIGYKPSMDIKEGVRRFVNWYREYYRV